MDDQEFLRLLDEYLEPPAEPNPEMAGVQIVWERESLEFGSRHIWDQHEITEPEVEEVLLAIPPYVEATPHPEHSNRTLFRGATRYDRWIVVICEDSVAGDTRYLKPITAFEPDEGVRYWERFK